MDTCTRIISFLDVPSGLVSSMYVWVATQLQARACQEHDDDAALAIHVQTTCNILLIIAPLSRVVGISTEQCFGLFKLMVRSDTTTISVAKTICSKPIIVVLPVCYKTIIIFGLACLLLQDGLIYTFPTDRVNNTLEISIHIVE